MIYKSMKHVSRDIQGKMRRIPGIVWCRRLFSPRFLLVLLITTTVVTTSITLLHLVNLMNNNMVPIARQHSLDIRSADENHNGLLFPPGENQPADLENNVLEMTSESDLPPSTVLAKQPIAGGPMKQPIAPDTFAKQSVVSPKQIVATPAKPSVSVVPPKQPITGTPLKQPIAPVTFAKQPFVSPKKIIAAPAKPSVSAVVPPKQPIAGTPLKQPIALLTLAKQPIVTPKQVIAAPVKPSVVPPKQPVVSVPIKQQINVAATVKQTVASTVIKQSIATTVVKQAVSETLVKKPTLINQPNLTKQTSVTPTKPRTFAAPRTQYFMSSDFEGFNNESGVATAIVPNIIHFLRFDQPQFKFTDVICILAAVKNHRPDHLYIHSNVLNFTGKYWDLLFKNKEFNKIFQIKNIELPINIFGQNFSTGWHKHHASDVTRIKILMEYGGIYVDNDSYIVKSLEKYRHFEMALAWDEDQFLGSQTLIAHSKARFLPLWLDSYRNNYHADKWYYNAGERPTTTVLIPHPELVHRVKLLFGAHIGLAFSVYQKYWPQWRDNFAVHLLLNFRWQFDKENFEKIKEFDEVNILNHNFTVGEMIRDVLKWNKDNS